MVPVRTVVEAENGRVPLERLRAVSPGGPPAAVEVVNGKVKGKEGAMAALRKPKGRRQ